MKESLLRLLACPHCKGELSIKDRNIVDNEVDSGCLSCRCGTKYPITNGIPRFVQSDGYVENFSFEWNRFSRTQLDSVNGTNISAGRFIEITGLRTGDLKDKVILEAGCGMGRFLEVAARGAREVVGVDLSFSVDAARGNLRPLRNVHLVQADIFNLPFKENVFDFIYSIGVLHHTPAPKQAFIELARFLREKGSISAWITPRPRLPFLPRATSLARIFTTRMKPEHLLSIIRKFLVFGLPIVRIPFIGKFLKGIFIPVCDYKGELSLNDKQLLEWSILDTFDLLSPRYLYSYTPDQVKEWCRKASLSDIITTTPSITLRAIKSKGY